jgi:hypothetical protein
LGAYLPCKKDLLDQVEANSCFRAGNRLLYKPLYGMRVWGVETSCECWGISTLGGTQWGEFCLPQTWLVCHQSYRNCQCSWLFFSPSPASLPGVTRTNNPRAAKTRSGKFMDEGMALRAGGLSWSQTLLCNAPGVTAFIRLK